MLRGHPGGYEKDIVHWSTPDDLPPLIVPRARAMFRISRALAGDETRRYLYSKRYSKCFVFISHTLKPPNRALVENTFESLRQQYVDPFEYHLVNEAGEDWRKALDVHLGRTTHFVVLLSDEYEKSQVCTYEPEKILERSSEVTILPFMIEGRSVPHPKLDVLGLHHRLLDDKDPQTNAQAVSDRVMKALEGG